MTTIRMIQKMDGSYRRSSSAEVTRMLGSGAIQLEGADGDEQANSVTYWYERCA